MWLLTLHQLLKTEKCQKHVFNKLERRFDLFGSTRNHSKSCNIDFENDI